MMGRQGRQRGRPLRHSRASGNPGQRGPCVIPARGKARRSPAPRPLVIPAQAGIQERSARPGRSALDMSHHRTRPTAPSQIRGGENERGAAGRLRNDAVRRSRPEPKGLAPARVTSCRNARADYPGRPGPMSPPSIGMDRSWPPVPASSCTRRPPSCGKAPPSRAAGTPRAGRSSRRTQEWTPRDESLANNGKPGPPGFDGSQAAGPRINKNLPGGVSPGRSRLSAFHRSASSRTT